MNRKDFLHEKNRKIHALVSPIILAEQSQVATTKSVERMRIGSNGSTYYYKIY